MRSIVDQDRPVGWLPTGDPFFAPIGEMRYDGDRVQCHLCGRWLKMVGGSHLIAAHEMTVVEYRELFRLFGNMTTAAPRTSERKRQTMLEQIVTGQRDQSVLGEGSSPPTVARWRSVATLHPGLMAEWHEQRNGDLDPYSLGQHSHRKVWWRCRQCGAEWQASPNQRTSAGRGCPACGRRRSIAATIQRNRSYRPPPGKSIAAKRPDLLVEWDTARNVGLDPYTLAAGSERKVWWRCSLPECSIEWQAAVGDRTRQQARCPPCRQKRAGERRALADRDKSFGALYPHLLDEWHPTKNADADPYAIKPGSERRRSWR